MITCMECGKLITPEDCYCDGVICPNGHEVVRRECPGTCNDCSPSEQFGWRKHMERSAMWDTVGATNLHQRFDEV